MSALNIDQSNGDLRRMHCPAAPDIESLTSTIKVLTEKIDTLISLNRDIIKWLLIVVCVIALGRSAFDVSKELLGGKAHAQAIEAHK